MRFFQGQTVRAEREAEALRALDAYQTVMKRVETCDGLERAFAQLCPDAQPYLWLQDYEQLPVRRWTHVRNGFSEMVYTVRGIRIPHERLVDDVSLDIPDQAAYKRARRAGEEVLLECAIEIDAALNEWSAQRTWQVDEADGPMADLVVEAMAASLFHLRYLFSDLAMTVVYWNAGPDIANPYVIEAETWKHAQSAPADRLHQRLAATPLTGQDHALFESIAFHDSPALQPRQPDLSIYQNPKTTRLTQIGRWLLFGLIAPVYIVVLYALLGGRTETDGNFVIVGAGILATFGTMALPGYLRRRRSRRDRPEAYRQPSAKELRAQLHPATGDKLRKAAALIIGGLFVLVIALSIAGELSDRADRPAQQPSAVPPERTSADPIQEFEDRREGVRFRNVIS